MEAFPCHVFGLFILLTKLFRYYVDGEEIAAIEFQPNLAVGEGFNPEASIDDASLMSFFIPWTKLLGRNF